MASSTSVAVACRERVANPCAAITRRRNCVRPIVRISPACDPPAPRPAVTHRCSPQTRCRRCVPDLRGLRVQPPRRARPRLRRRRARVRQAAAPRQRPRRVEWRRLPTGAVGRAPTSQVVQPFHLHRRRTKVDSRTSKVGRRRTRPRGALRWPARRRSPAVGADTCASALAIPVVRPPPPHGTSTASMSSRSSASSRPIVPFPAITSSSRTGWTK